MSKRVYQRLEHLENHKRLLSHLAIYPDSILKQKAIEFTEAELQSGLHKEMYEKMFEIMHHFGGIGLAANQARYLKRIFVMDIDSEEEFTCCDKNSGEKISPHKMVITNPQIIEQSNEQTKMEEGCLSLPDIRVPVTRPKTIVVKFLDENLREKIYFMDNLLSKCVQHEIDHLDGIVITDKPSIEMKNLVYNKKLKELAKCER